MKNIIFITSLFVLFLALSSCNKSDAEKGEAKTEPVPVKIKTVHPSKLIEEIQVAGTVKALEDAMISPEEGGVVKEWVARKGQYVKKDEVIILLKDEVMKATFEAAEAQYKMAELNAEKQQKVYEEQGISELQYKNLLYTRDAAKANADLMKARYERTRIKSPIDGVVDNIIPNPGEYAPPGVPCARVVNVSVVKIQVEVPEKYAGSMSKGIPALITFDALGDDTLRGNVGFVSATVSSANRTVIVEIVINNPFRKLKPEMVAKVRLQQGIKNNAVLVNESVVQLVDRERRIVYVERNGAAEERVVEIGARQGNQIEIVRGLNAGERLVVSGFQKLVNGSPVVVEE